MATDPGNPRTARFGPFEADFRAGELRKDGRRIRLQNQPLQILAFLVEHRGQVVTREELRDKLWPADTFVDFEHGLNNAMNRLREALGDSAESPSYIETLPKRGYRFVATLVGPPEISTPAPPRLPSLWPYAITMAVVLVALIVFSLRGRISGSSVAKIHSVAVLPLANLTGDRGQDYLVDGVTEALTAEMARNGELRVTSWTSAIRYKDTKKAVSEIARELAVDAVIKGSVKRTGDRLSITAQLVDGRSEKEITSRSYEREQASLELVEREITRDLTRAMGISPGTRQQARLSRPPVKAAAYDAYMRGLWHLGPETREDNDDAVRLLEGAVALEPDFAEAHAALSAAYRIRSNSLEPGDKQWDEKAFAAVERALHLDPELAEAYAARGFLLWSRTNHYPHERAAREFHRALSFNPNLAEAHHQLANIYNHTGLLDKAAVEIQQALALDPLNTGARFRAGVNLIYKGKYEESLAAIRDSRRFTPPLWIFQTAFALFQLGRRTEARERVEEFLKDDPRDPGGLLAGMLALLAAADHNRPLAERFTRQALAKEENYNHFHHTLYVLASAHALLGEPAQATKELERLADEGFPCYPLFAADPDLSRLHGYPAFDDFLKRQRKQWEHFKAVL